MLLEQGYHWLERNFEEQQQEETILVVVVAVVAADQQRHSTWPVTGRYVASEVVVAVDLVDLAVAKLAVARHCSHHRTETNE